MIPSAYITEWRQFAPWPESYQVEQDLVISKALVQIYSDVDLREDFAFRGGTSLQKIFFKSPTRYSEDIDLVQVPKKPIGPSINKLRSILDSWLGSPTVDRGGSRVTLKYRFTSEDQPSRPMRLKIEINTGEHFTQFGYKRAQFHMKSTWFTGSAEILTFEIEEILGTKLRALYQRKKGRDLYDMAMAYQYLPNLNDQKMIDCFMAYMKHGGHSVSRAEYEANLFEKLTDKSFLEDIQPLLKSGSKKFDMNQVGEIFKNRSLILLPGDPWKGK